MTPYILQHPRPYRILAAIRGCDSQLGLKEWLYLSPLKCDITGRIRAICFSPEGCYGLYTPYRLNKKEFDEICKAIEVLRDAQHIEHYIQHLADALEETYSHEIWGEYGLEVLQKLRSYLRSKL